MSTVCCFLKVGGGVGGDRGVCRCLRILRRRLGGLNVRRAVSVTLPRLVGLVGRFRHMGTGFSFTECSFGKGEACRFCGTPLKRSRR